MVSDNWLKRNAVMRRYTSNFEANTCRANSCGQLHPSSNHPVLIYFLANYHDEYVLIFEC